jgi:hypothetical protein
VAQPAEVEEALSLPAAAEVVPAPPPPPAAAQPAAPADADAGEQRATVTLGNLYLSQRHHTAAEKIFRAVLARQPDNEAARRGLAEALRSRPRLKAGDLLHNVGSGSPPAHMDRRQRTKTLFKAYLARLRGRSIPDVS